MEGAENRNYGLKISGEKNETQQFNASFDSITEKELNLLLILELNRNFINVKFTFGFLEVSATSTLKKNCLCENLLQLFMVLYWEDENRYYMVLVSLNLYKKNFYLSNPVMKSTMVIYLSFLYVSVSFEFELIIFIR